MDYSQYAGKGALPSNQHSEVKWKLLKPRKKLLSSKKKMSMHILRQWSKVYLPIVSLPYFPFHHQIGDGSRELLPPGLLADVSDLTSLPVTCHAQVPKKHIRGADLGPDLMSITPTTFSRPTPKTWIGNARRISERSFGLPSSFLKSPRYLCFLSQKINLSLLEQTEPKECK